MRDSRSVLVTGAARGLGLEAAKILAQRQRGHSVVLTARSQDDAATAVETIRQTVPNASLSAAALDMASFGAIREFSSYVLEHGLRFDVVLHNAGVIFAAPVQRLTIDGIEETLAVHAVGPLLLSKQLVPAMNRPSRLVFVGSGLHRPTSPGPKVEFRFGDPNLAQNYHPGRAYKNSKLAQIWIAREWQRRYGPEGIQADVVCPGFVPVTAGARSKGLQRFMLMNVLPFMPFANSLQHAAQIFVQWCERSPTAPGGNYFDGKRIALPSGDALNDGLAAEFFDWAERAISERT